MLTLFLKFLAIHPFKDGNGRISRALTNLLLLKAGYSYVPYVSLDEIIEQTKTEYYLALRSTPKSHKTKRENILPWVEYLLGALVKQAEQAQKLMELNSSEMLLSKRQAQIYHLFERDQELGVAEISRLLKGEAPWLVLSRRLHALSH